MAFIAYISPENIDPEHRVMDEDNILRIHGIHSAVMKYHQDLYLELMRKSGPLTLAEREMIALRVSTLNKCHY